MTFSTHWNLSWAQRSRESAVHFNPAFCGELLALVVLEYGRARREPLPLMLAFIVLPLLLHAPTREALPRRANTIFAAWSTEHDEILPEIADRTLSLRPATREALLLLAQLGALKIERDGVTLGGSPLRHSLGLSGSTSDVEEMRRAAKLLGRWFAQQATPFPLLQVMGVRP